MRRPTTREAALAAALASAAATLPQLKEGEVTKGAVAADTAIKPLTTELSESKLPDFTPPPAEAERSREEPVQSETLENYIGRHVIDLRNSASVATAKDDARLLRRAQAIGGYIRKNISIHTDWLRAQLISALHEARLSQCQRTAGYMQGLLTIVEKGIERKQGKKHQK